MKLFGIFSVKKDVYELRSKIDEMNRDKVLLLESIEKFEKKNEEFGDIIEELEREQILLKEALENTTNELNGLKDEIYRLVSMTKRK